MCFLLNNDLARSIITTVNYGLTPLSHGSTIIFACPMGHEFSSWFNYVVCSVRSFFCRLHDCCQKSFSFVSILGRAGHCRCSELLIHVCIGASKNSILHFLGQWMMLSCLGAKLWHASNI